MSPLRLPPLLPLFFFPRACAQEPKLGRITHHHQAGWGWGGGFVKEMSPLDLTGRSSQRNCQRRTVLSLDGKLFGQWPRRHQGRGPQSPPGRLQGWRSRQRGAGCCGSLGRGRRGGWLRAPGLQLPSRPGCPAVPLRQDRNLGDDDGGHRDGGGSGSRSLAHSLLPGCP